MVVLYTRHKNNFDFPNYKPSSVSVYLRSNCGSHKKRRKISSTKGFVAIQFCILMEFSPNSFGCTTRCCANEKRRLNSTNLTFPIKYWKIYFILISIPCSVSFLCLRGNFKVIYCLGVVYISVIWKKFQVFSSINFQVCFSWRSNKTETNSLCTIFSCIRLFDNIMSVAL